MYCNKNDHDDNNDNYNNNIISVLTQNCNAHNPLNKVYLVLKEINATRLLHISNKIAFTTLVKFFS